MRKETCAQTGTKVFSALAAGIFLLSACTETGEKQKNNIAISEEFDNTEADFGYQFVAESENGYYIWECLNQEQFYPRLMFMDKVSGRVMPLCNKPDCVHEGTECNAYFRDLSSEEGGVDRHYLQYYEGNLYAVGLSEDAYVSIFRIEADGSEWEISTKLYRTDYAGTGIWEPPELLIDGGYIYFVDWYQKVKKLERIPINGGTSEVVFEGDSDASEVDIYRLKSNEGSLFFQTISYPDDIPENAVGGLYCYDPKTGRCDLIKNLVGPYSIHHGSVYYTGTEGLCCYLMKERTTEILADKPMDVPDITLTENYIILCNQMEDYGLLIYDYEGNEIGAVPNNLGLRWYFGGSSDRLFGEFADDVGWKRCFLDLTRPLAELRWEELKAE